MSQKKQDILKYASILFAEKGFNETSIAELAQATKVAEGTIFYHFKTKTDLFLAVLADIEKGVTREFNEYISQERFENGLEMMETVIAFFLYLAGQHQEWFVLLQRNYAYQLAEVNEQCRCHLESIYNTLVDCIEEAILLGRKDGSIREMPSRKIALILFSTVYGLIWLKFHKLYDTGTLYQEVLATCRRILRADSSE